MLLGEKYNLKLKEHFGDTSRYESSIIIKNDEIINHLCNITDKYYKYLLYNNHIHTNLLFDSDEYYELNIDINDDLYKVGIRSIIIYTYINDSDVRIENSLYANFQEQFYGEDVVKYRIGMVKATTKFQNINGLLIANLCGFKVDFITYDADINNLYLLKSKKIDYHFDFSNLDFEFIISKTDLSYNELCIKNLHNIIYCKYSVYINDEMTKEDVYNICCDYILDEYNIFGFNAKILFSIDSDKVSCKWLSDKFYIFFNTEEIKSIITITYMNFIHLVDSKYVLKVALRR